jgi:transposase
LKARGIDLIAPHISNHAKTQDGRKLRRYVRRWKVERSIAWLQNFRRLVTRYENSITMFRAFFHVALMMIALRRL